MSYAVLRCCTRIPRDESSQMRTHFKERNNSSTSLEGMERPVRSFKSFIRTTPPHPSETDKSLPSLPLTPAPWIPIHPDRELDHSRPTTSHSTLERNPSVASWKAPAEWYNDNASEKSAHSLSSPTLAPRSFAPLIPEPSPGILGMETEPTAWLPPSAPPASRLLPIYERATANTDLDPPGTPPETPLPAPPARNQSSEIPSPPGHQRTNSPPSRNDKPQGQSLSRTDSDASTKEKAFASLGLDPSDPSQRGRKRTDRTYLRGKKLRALNKGSPLADDSWEDEDMDDKTRELSFSQDYHDLLADQYQEMNVRAQEVLSSGGAHQVYDSQIKDTKARPVQRGNDLVPRPLSWQKSSGHTTPRSRSRDKDVDESSGSGSKSKHNRLSALLTHRFGAPEVNKEDGISKERQHPNPKQSSSPEPDQALDDALRFSRFFPSSRPLRFGKKHKRNVSVKSSPEATSLPQPSPLIRLPGGLAVVRTHSPSPASKSDILSDKSPTSQHTRNSSQYGSDYSHTNSDHRSSCNSHISTSPATVPVAMRSAYRTSVGSSYSHRSSTTHPIPQKPPPPAPPPPPPVMPSPPMQAPTVSPKSVNQVRTEEKSAEHRYTPRFIEKARESRRRRATEARQDRLKRSIKVLGPTDPGVAQAGYVREGGRFEQSDSDVEGRVPGYMVGGTG